MILYYILLCILYVPMACADIILDGTLGPQGALEGPNFAIEAKLGQQYGSNLFHSFSQFDINQGETATFSGPNSIDNVISRVTGGNPSHIDGLFRSTIPDANVYFLNPAGIMFEQNSSLDIQGSFHASTADTLHLGSDGQFSIKQPEQSLLTIAEPKAFGFLTDMPASITVQDTKLSVSEGKTLSLIGGNLHINGELLSITGRVPVVNREFSSQLSAPYGRINLASVASKGNVIPTEYDLKVDTGKGKIISNQSKISTAGIGGGDIFIRAGQFKLVNSDLNGDTLADKNGGIIDVQADDITLQGTTNYSSITSNNFSSGYGGTINLSTKQLTLTEGAGITSVAIGTGNGGRIFIKSDNLTFYGKFISEIAIPSTINAVSFGGQGGRIDIKSNKLDLINGAQIGSSSFGTKNGGSTFVKINENLTISGNDEAGYLSGIFSASQGNTGDGGYVEVEAGSINLSNGGRIDALTLGPGNAGTISVTADKLKISGKNINYNDGLTQNSAITSSSLGLFGNNDGDSGTITVQANAINLSDDGEISTSAVNAGGGNITVKSSNLLYLQNDGQITTSVYGGTGDGGNITIESPTFIVLGQGKIKAQANEGNGGNINIQADNLIKSPNSLISASSNLGLDGEIKIESPETNMDHLLAILPNKFIKTSKLKTPCNSRLADGMSSFIVIKSEGIRNSPDDLLPSGPLLQGISSNKKITNTKNNTIIANIPTHCLKL